MNANDFSPSEKQESSHRVLNHEQAMLETINNIICGDLHDKIDRLEQLAY